MRKSRFTEERIVGIFQAYAAGARAAAFCRKHGMSNAKIQTQTVTGPLFCT
jgi:hypothetical protein